MKILYQTLIRKKYLFAAILLIALIGFFTSLNSRKHNIENNTGWTTAEKQLIESYGDSIMRLWVVNDNTDSLFLRQACTPLSSEEIADPLFKLLKHQMLLTVTNPENEGVGIAAPQVGIARRLVAVQRLDKEGEPFEFYINPHFTHLSDDKKSGWEGCLSVPGKRGLVARSTTVVIEYNKEEDFQLATDTIRGFTAIIFQHELDHLDGTLYIDKADTLINR